MIELILLDSSTVATFPVDPHRVLAPEELERYTALRADTRRREFLLGRLLLKTALTAGDNHRVRDFGMIGTTVSAAGKPAVAGAEFSLSHDGDAILLAMGDQPVGVDIERVQDFDDSMMRTCFGSDERRRIVRASRPDRVATLLWCLKEAAAKATGIGLLSDLGKTPRGGLFRRGGFVRLAGCERAYAVCSPIPISPTNIMPARPRFDRVFAAFCG